MKNISRRSLLRALGLGSAATVVTGRAQTRPAGDTFTFTVLHTNDTHDRLEPTTLTGKDASGKDYRVQYGGVARIKTLIDTLRARSINPVVLDAGDVFTGTLYGMIYKGLADLAYMEAFGTQAQTIGNHEFDGGPAQLAEYLKNASFPVVSANIDASAEPLLAGLIKPSTVLTVGGKRLGVVGVTTPTTPVTSSPGDKVKFLDPVTSVQGAVDALRAQGVTFVVLLSHLGYDVDQEIARRLRGVSVIVGGHSHTPLGRYDGPGQPASEGAYPTVVQSAADQPCLVVQAWEWGKHYGQLRVTLDAAGVPVSWRGVVYPVTEQYKADLRLGATLRAFMVPLEGYRKTVVGTAGVRLNGDRADVRKRETNLANLVADANLARTQKFGTVVSFQNGGGVRASIEAGPITQGQVIDVQPFGNTLFVLDLTGAEVRAALENGVSQWEAGAGRFLQVAGLKYTFDLARPVGQRVTDVQIGSPSAGFRPLDPAATYRTVINNFLAAGGDGFDVFKNARGFRQDTYLPDYTVFSEFVGGLKDVRPAVEGRITILNEKK